MARLYSTCDQVHGWAGILGFPEWTEAQTYEQDAIQFLRLNELRDSINEILFPYLITITPYFRMVSWLTWIFAKLDEEIHNASGMTARDYVNKTLRYYGIFASARVETNNEKWILRVLSFNPHSRM